MPKSGGIWHPQLLVFQQLLPLPLSFKFSLFASSKNGRRLAFARSERDL
jgi:hypothetical protein